MFKKGLALFQSLGLGLDPNSFSWFHKGANSFLNPLIPRDISRETKRTQEALITAGDRTGRRAQRGHCPPHYAVWVVVVVPSCPSHSYHLIAAPGPSC